MDSHTLIQALIYLGAAALIVPIAVRLGLGSVLGYLIAGCIIGPWALRLVTDAEAILHFAEIGVVLMLFVIGLELDPQRLWKLRASVFGGGALQMVACGVLIGLFCMLLGLRWQVAELIGMTLALSSTAIAMQAMNERNLTVSQMGRSAFAVLLFRGYRRDPAGGDDPAAGGQRRRHLADGFCPLRAESGRSAGAGGGPWALSDPAAAALLSPVPACASVQRRGPVPRSSALAYCWKRWGCRWRWGRFSPGCCWPAPNIVMRWRVILSRLKDCCWGCSLSASACRLISAPSVTHPLRIVILLVGFRR